MLDQLKELLEMQRVLDESIFMAKGIKEYPLENMKIALFVELGEMMNEMPTMFKHWKSSAVDNRGKALEEFVDALHFVLSITNEMAELDRVEYYAKYFIKNLHGWSALECICEIVDDFRYEYYNSILADLLEFGVVLGFTWEEIYDAYKEKNKVNYERLKNGY